MKQDSKEIQLKLILLIFQIIVGSSTRHIFKRVLHFCFPSYIKRICLLLVFGVQHSRQRFGRFPKFIIHRLSEI